LNIKKKKSSFKPLLQLSSDWRLAKRFRILKKLCSHDIICSGSAEGKNINITSDNNPNHTLKQQLNSAVPIHKGEESK
jgi:hypothetical protein